MRVAWLIFAALLTACAGSDNVRYGPQEWDGAQFVVETRPSPVQVGMNEFIVIATREHSRPGVGFVVYLRIGESGEWHQAIQDGYTGVYRRAVRVGDPANDVLNVKVKRSKEEVQTILYFPLGGKTPSKS